LFHVVLFEPEIPPNTGNIIRLCANTGSILHLVKPLGFSLDNKQLQRSGLDYHDLATVQLHDDIDAFFRQIGATRVFAVETGSAHCYSEMSYLSGDAFIFGRETSGLPPHLMNRIGGERCVFIPMQSQNRSLNLSNAVALVVYEAWRQNGFIRSPRAVPDP